MATARWKLAAGAATLGTLLALGGAEYWARGQVPTRIQKIYSADQYQLEIIDGVPTWKQNLGESAERWNLDCIDERPDAPRVAIMGSSIFYGVRLDQEDSIGPQLTEQLAPLLGEEPCISNLSEAGFTFQNQWARAGAVQETIQPDLVIWEIWENSPFEFRMLGGAAYNFGRLAVDSAGYPNPYGLGEGSNQWLLNRSGLYRYLVFGSAQEDRDGSQADWSEFTTNQVTMMMDWADEEGFDLLLVYCPALRDDFETTAARTERSYGHVEPLAESRGVSQVHLAREFTGMDPSTLGIDTCCHFNPLGTREVVNKIAPVAAELLGNRSRSSR
jgi:hypothetical protein